jgi:hypothetical protein
MIALIFAYVYIFFCSGTDNFQSQEFVCRISLRKQFWERMDQIAAISFSLVLFYAQTNGFSRENLNRKPSIFP